MSIYSNIHIDAKNVWHGTITEAFKGEPLQYKFSANPALFIIRQAWEGGADMEDLADGFGEGCGTMGGDWSGIRDSTSDARAKMLARALNHLFGS